MTDPMCWIPALHCYDGSCDGQLVAPHYATMPDYIQVFDVAVRTSGWTRKQKLLWRKARNLGVQRWGYPVQVTELKDATRYPPEGITIGRFTTTPGYSSNSYGGFGLYPRRPPEVADYDVLSWEDGKGFAMINDIEVNGAFYGNVTGRLAGVICHEVGHALGFGHGGFGIMESAVNPPYYPDGFELSAVAQYWGMA